MFNEHGQYCIYTKRESLITNQSTFNLSNYEGEISDGRNLHSLTFSLLKYKTVINFKWHFTPYFGVPLEIDAIESDRVSNQSESMLHTFFFKRSCIDNVTTCYMWFIERKIHVCWRSISLNWNGLPNLMICIFFSLQDG